MVIAFAMFSSSRQFIVAVALSLLSTACVHVPPRGRQEFRRQQFFATHSEVPPAIANAIKTGHVIVGMDTEEVWVVVGDPIKKSMFRGGAVEVWLYPAVRFHQGPGSHGRSSFRLVFIDGRLRVIEPF